NAASGRVDAVSSLINLLHHLWVDVDRELSAGVVDDPDVQHRGRADVDRPERARRAGGHQAELEAERREADVLVLVPRGERPTGIGTEHAEPLHLEHRPEKHWPMLAVCVYQALRALG